MDADPLLIVLSENWSDTRWPAVPLNSMSATFSVPAKATVCGVPREKRPVVPTFETPVPLGGMNRSGPVLEPEGVATATGPPSLQAGTLNLIEPDEADVTSGLAPLSVRSSSWALASKFDPETVISSPAAASAGEIDEMLGAADSATVKLSGLVTEPFSPAPTVIGPVVAPAGTFTDRAVALAPLTVAGVPLNSTVFELGVVEKPVPSIVTASPTCPRPGETWMIESSEDSRRVIERRLPAASQL